MYPYLIIFFATAFLALNSFNQKETNAKFFFLYLAAIAIFVGISDMLGGYDRYIYCEVFSSNSESFRKGNHFSSDIYNLYLAKEPIYGIINTIIGLITPNRYIFILIYTLIIYAIYGVCFYRYTSKPFFALLVFLGLMFFFTFTYLRQVLATGIIWLSLPYYKERKTTKFLIMIIVASLIHNSALVMALLYFIPLRKWQFGRIMIVMSLLFILGLIGVGGTFEVVGGITGNENISNHADVAEYGFRYEYVIEALFFLFILYKNYGNIAKDRESLSYLNLYLMFCGILLLFCKSSDGGRIAWYGVMGIVIMLTSFCNKERGITLKISLTFLFFILYLRILLAWGVLLSPYKTFLTNGVREGDYIHESYEYDDNYERDKFYNL